MLLDNDKKTFILKVLQVIESSIPVDLLTRNVQENTANEKSEDYRKDILELEKIY